jgi:transcription elongation factor Elf1
MSYNIKLSEGGHSWEKQNLVTVVSKKGSHDVLKCKHCGIEGKTTSLWTIRLKGSYSSDKVYNCSNNKTAVKIQITQCHAFGQSFRNLIPGSIHDVIAPPEDYKNDKGTWVMGVGEPVKVLPNEFKII